MRTRTIAALILASSLGACSALLPVSRTESPTFAEFDAARKAVETLVPQHSTLAHVQELGLDPVRQPNTTILTHADIVRRIANGGVLHRADLHPGILTCLSARDACAGWELNIANITRARTGNFFADFINFQRRTETRGWRFQALILLVDDVVVYRGWGGQPSINENEVQTNPLGPLQDSGPSLVTR